MINKNNILFKKMKTLKTKTSKPYKIMFLKMEQFIPIAKPNLKGNELKYLTECITSGWISSSGKFIELFEKKGDELWYRHYLFFFTHNSFIFKHLFFQSQGSTWRGFI